MLRIGTDCSGLCSVSFALKELGIKYEYVFASEKDQYARKTLINNHEIKIVYEDMTVPRDLEKVDLYACGFPCQPFSLAGHRLASKDPRGNIFLSVLEAIKQTEPKVFILENVRGILSAENGEYFKKIIELLNELGAYDICYKLINTRDYGVPQNRERVYVIGTSIQVKTFFQWPKKVKCEPLENFVEWNINQCERIPVRRQEVLETLSRSKATFLNLGFQNFKISSYEHFAPCVLAQACYWNVKMGRKATINELLRLQGLPNDIKQVVSNTQFKKQIGNAMSVNVLKCIIINITAMITPYQTPNNN